MSIRIITNKIKKVPVNQKFLQWQIIIWIVNNVKANKKNQ